MISRRGGAGRGRELAARFRKDQTGTVAIIFCVALAPLAVAAGAAIDYAKASRAREKLVIASDAAAVAAVVDLQKGLSVDQAQKTASAVLSSNAPDLAPYVTINAAISYVDNRTATTTVTAKAQLPNNFGGLFGKPTTEIAHEAVAQGYLDSAAFTGVAKSGGTFKGTISGDPEVGYADGTMGFVDCPAPNWYNALSDAGIQVNFACTFVDGYNFIRKVTILLGDHVVSYDVYDGPNKDIFHGSGGSFYTGMPAVITVDGKEFAPEFSKYSEPLSEIPVVESPQGKIYVVPHRDTKIDFATLKMYDFTKVKVVTPIYTIDVVYHFGWYNQQGAITFSATDPGLCGTPGGVWGRSISGGKVGFSNREALGRTAENPFMVIGREAKSPEFFWTPDCAVATAARQAKLPRLVK